MVVLEESMEVANAMGKLRTSEAKIVELRKKCYPATAAGPVEPASVQQASDSPENVSPAVDGTQEIEGAEGNVEGAEGSGGTVQNGNGSADERLTVT